MNAWPLDEAYIDYVEGAPVSGVVNLPDEYPTIDADLLVSLNEAGGETNVSTGWHAIEFLLWGQDLSAEGPGARPVTDFTTAANADRRLAYLAVVSDLLVGHLQSLVDAWAPEVDDNYRAEFLALSTDEALGMILTGLGELSRGEVAGERLTVAYEEHSQENEHSCFSDNTTSDIVANAAGIQNVYLGAVGDVEGPGIHDLVEAADSDLASKLQDEIAASVAAAESIPAPFDKSIAPGVADDDPGRVAMFDKILSFFLLAVTFFYSSILLGLVLYLS
jgi:putative iron-regulated protein